MRFCMVTTFYPPYHFGGDALYVQQLACELAGRGHHVEVVHCIDAYKLLSRKMPDDNDKQIPNLKVHRLTSGYGALSPLATQQTGRPVLKSRRLREILSQRFDVIHYHNISLIGGPAVLAYGKALKLYTWSFRDEGAFHEAIPPGCIKHRHVLIFRIGTKHPSRDVEQL